MTKRSFRARDNITVHRTRNSLPEEERMTRVRLVTQARSHGEIIAIGFSLLLLNLRSPGIRDTYKCGGGACFLQSDNVLSPDTPLQSVSARLAALDRSLRLCRKEREREKGGGGGGEREEKEDEASHAHARESRNSDRRMRLTIGARRCTKVHNFHFSSLEKRAEPSSRKIAGGRWGRGGEGGEADQFSFLAMQLARNK